MLVEGVYRVLTWVVSVMLPPMAIFFPLFTLLEDFGYLPRVAFVMDHAFQRCKACGKQALTMCMGLGCNAVGVTGCRIIDSPRERLIAILTNCLVPCNGRFPAMIAIITMFFVGTQGSSLLAATILTGVILLGVAMTFLLSRLLSVTVLKGMPSSFTLELPPYRAAPGGSGDHPLCVGPHSVRTGTGGGGSSSGRPVDLAVCQYNRGGKQHFGSLYRCAGSLRPSAGTGRSYSDGLYFGVACQ